jgi:hypothetical protein
MSDFKKAFKNQYQPKTSAKDQPVTYRNSPFQLSLRVCYNCSTQCEEAAIPVMWRRCVEVCAQTERAEPCENERV